MCLSLPIDISLVARLFKRMENVQFSMLGLKLLDSLKNMVAYGHQDYPLSWPSLRTLLNFQVVFVNIYKTLPFFRLIKKKLTVCIGIKLL